MCPHPLPQPAGSARHRKSSWARKPAALAERVEQAHALDPVVRRLSAGVVRALPTGPRTDALHGVPFGQPGPSGAGTAAARLLDLGRAARPVPRHRPRRPHADRRRDRRHRAGRGYRAGRLVGAAPGPAAGRPGARRLPGQRGLAVPRLTGRPGQRAAPVRPGAVRLRAGHGHRRGLPGRPPGAAAGRGRQPRRAGQPPGRARLARPVRARPAARPPAGPPPARLPVAARVPAGRRGERAVRPVLTPGRAATPGTNRR